MANACIIRPWTLAQTVYPSGLPAGTSPWLFVRAKNVLTGAYTVLSSSGTQITLSAASLYYEAAALTAFDPGASDYFGQIVAISGGYAVIGAWAKDPPVGLADSGAAYVLELDSGTGEWVHSAVLYPTDAYPGDSFGYGVSVSGTYAVIGAPQSDPTGKTDAGAAYVFERNSGTGAWEQKTKLIASDSMPSDSFGTVGVSGTYAIVGAYSKKQLGIANFGAVYLFERNVGSGVWEQKASLYPSDYLAGSYYGSSVSISGTYAIVGAYQKAGGGGAYVLERNTGTGAWEEKAILTCPDATTATFGISVAIDNSYAIVGGPAKSVSSLSSAGGAYIYERVSGTWTLTATINNPDPAASDSFGNAVAVNGIYAVIGCNSKDPAGKSAAGSTYLYKRNSTTGVWENKIEWTASDGAASDQFGASVGVSGTHVLSGAYRKAVNGVSPAGGAYVYELPSTTTISPLATILAPSTVSTTDNATVTIATLGTDADYTYVVSYSTTISSLSAASIYYEAAALTAFDPVASDHFGQSVAVSGSYAIVGAYWRYPLSIATAGVAYVLELNGSTMEWEHKAVLYPTDAYTNDLFGVAVFISGTYAVVGASASDPGGKTDAGAAYAFERNSGTGAWEQKTKLVASDAMPSDSFGYSVGVSGTYAIAGAHVRTRLGASSSGGAYVFERNSGSGVWEQKSVLFPSDLPTASKFGWSVSVSGTYAIVGAYLKTGGGGAYIFERNSSTGAWEQKAILTCPDSTIAQFGYSVSIDGTYAVVSAQNKSVNSLATAGGVYMYERVASTWTQKAILENPDPAATDQFGYSVAVSGVYAVIGCVNKDPASKGNAGATYLYKRNSTTGVWESKMEWTASDGLASDQMGWSVGLSGTHVVSSAYNKTVTGLSTAGGAYVY
ncbi:hypothetical protein JKP88DRAFT_181536, partial [Tribonema minus]